MIVRLSFSFVFIHFKDINDDQFIRKNFIKLEKNQNTHYYEDAQLELAQPKKTYFCLCAFLLLNLTPHVRPTTIRH